MNPIFLTDDIVPKSLSKMIEEIQTTSYLCLSDVPWQSDVFSLDANILSRLELHPDVNIGVFPPAHLHDGQLGQEGGQPGLAFGDLLTEIIFYGPGG